MRVLFVIGLIFLLAACGSSSKKYTDATPLDDIQPDLDVKPLWKKNVGALTKDHHAQLPPAVVDQVVYVASTNGEVVALNADKGNRIWKIDAESVLTGGLGAGRGVVIVGSREAEIIALEQANGAQRWRSKLGAEMLAVPQIDDRQVIVQTIDGKVIALDAMTGEQNWSYSHSIPALTLRGTSNPLILNDRVLAGFSDGKLVSLARDTGKLQWTTAVAVPRGRTDIERLVDIDGLFAANDDTVYVTSYQGNLASIAVATGETQWTREISSYTGLVIGESVIYLSDADGLIWALDISNGGTLWRQDGLKGREPSVPVLLNNALAVGDYQGYVHWLALDDGRFIARRSLGSVSAKRSVSTAPQVVAQRIYVRDNLGTLAAFELGALITGQ